MSDLWDELEKDAMASLQEEDAGDNPDKGYYTRAEVDELIRKAVREATRPEDKESEEEEDKEHEEGSGEEEQ